MKTTMLVLAVALALGACDGTGMEAPDTGSDVVGAPCCRHYPSGLQVPGCWMCSDGILRCVGVECQAGSATMPMCSDQPGAPYPHASPSCE
jgi:hypothetical protein